jgi:hypothetical protein
MPCSCLVGTVFQSEHRASEIRCCLCFVSVSCVSVHRRVGARVRCGAWAVADWPGLHRHGARSASARESDMGYGLERALAWESARRTEWAGCVSNDSSCQRPPRREPRSVLKLKPDTPKPTTKRGGRGPRVRAARRLARRHLDVTSPDVSHGGVGARSCGLCFLSMLPRSPCRAPPHQRGPRGLYMGL